MLHLSGNLPAYFRLKMPSPGFSQANIAKCAYRARVALPLSPDAAGGATAEPAIGCHGRPLKR